MSGEVKMEGINANSFEIVKPSEEAISKTEAAKQVKLLINLCDPDEGKPNKLIALTEEVRKELGDPPGRENVLKIASYIKYPLVEDRQSLEYAVNEQDRQRLYQLMYIVGDQLLLKEEEQSQLDLERINSDSVYRNQQYNRIVNRIRVVGEHDESSLLDTCSVLMKEHDFSETKLEFAREWVKEQLNPQEVSLLEFLPKTAFFRQEEPQKSEEKEDPVAKFNRLTQTPDSSIPAPILEKDLGKKEPISDDEQAAIAEVDALLHDGSDGLIPEEVPSEDKDLKKGTETHDRETHNLLVSLLAEGTPPKEEISYSPKELQEKAIKLKEMEEEKEKLTTSGEFLSEEEGGRVDQIDKDKKEIDYIFERVFGSRKVNGLFAQAFHGIDYTIVDSIDDHDMMVELQKRLVQLGKDCCIEGNLDVRGKELHSIYTEAKDVLVKPDNNKEPKLSEEELFNKFLVLVKVSGEKEETMTYSSQGLQEMAKELEQLELDRKAGEQIDEKEIIRINNIFLEVFGLGDHGLVTQAFCGYKDIRDFNLDGQDEIYKLRTKLVQLGKDSCLEGKIVNKQQLADIYVAGLHILFQENKRTPKLKSDEFWNKFEKLVTVGEEKKD